MTFYAFGLNYQTAPVAVREAFALGDEARRQLYELLTLTPGAEVILVSTCNRTEVYLFGDPQDVAVVQAALAVRAGAAWPAEHAFFFEDEAAVLHVLRVASGVISQVLGDAQILSQVKEAYRAADDAGRIGTVLHRLMHTAFRTAKRVRTETALAEGAVSISSLAVFSARRHFAAVQGAGIEGREVLLLGAGQMGIAALRALRSMGVRRITLANRSRPRAEEVAAEFGASVVDWDARHAAAARADLVLVASGAPDHVLLAADLPERAGAPALVVDVALPRNVEPAVGRREGYLLLDLDALNEGRAQTAARRAAALPAAEALCQDGLREFVGWVLHHEALQPALRALRDTFDAIRTEAIAQHAHRFEGADREEIDRLTKSILQKLLAVPIVRLKSTETDSLDFARGVRFLSHVFSRPGCEDPSARDAAAALPPAAEGCPFAAMAAEAPPPEDPADAPARYAR